MLFARLKVAAAATLALGVVTASAMVLAKPLGPYNPPNQATVNRAAPLPSRAEVRDALKNWWNRLDTLQFRERSTELGPDGRPRPGSPTSIVDYAHAPGNRRAVRHGSINSEGAETFILERRFDGKTQTNIGADGKFPPKVQSVVVYDQPDSRDRTEGEHGTITRMFLLFADGPASKPLYTYIDTEPNLDISRAADGKPRAILTVKGPAGEARFELDPDHDYLPRKVDGIFHMVVTKFARVGGVWFPVEGTDNVGEKDRQSRFEVVDLKINQPIPDSRFTIPPELKARPAVTSRKPGAKSS